MTALREALEAALVENPNDLAAHMAYADHLHEQGDPRGELIQVQLALEDEATPRADRERLRQREEELLKETRAACLGPKLAAVLDREPQYPQRLRIERGWLTSYSADYFLDGDLANALFATPETRLLREFAIGYLPGPEYRAPDDPDILALLTGAKHLTHLRKLHLGTAEGFAALQNEPKVYNSRWELTVLGEPVWDWITTLPRLEELYLESRTSNLAGLFALPSLTHLRVLQVNLTDEYPLDVLAQNPALTNLTQLSLHPLAVPMDGDEGPYLGLSQLHALAGSRHLKSLTHLRFQKSNAGDEGLAALRDSGLLARLQFLDLAMGTITDAGAELLATADLKRLEVLDVTHNALTPAGQRRLGTALGKKLTLRMDLQENRPHPEWVYYGEME